MVANVAIMGMSRAAPAVLLINSPEKIVTETTTKITTTYSTPLRIDNWSVSQMCFARNVHLKT